MHVVTFGTLFAIEKGEGKITSFSPFFLAEGMMIKRTLLISLLFLCITPLGASADDSDLFLFNVEPNVLIILDGSGSMDFERVPGFAGGDVDQFSDSNTRMDVAYYVLRDLLDADDDGDIDNQDEVAMGVQFGFVAFHSEQFGGDRGNVADIETTTVNTCGAWNGTGYIRWKNEIGDSYSDIWTSIWSVKARGWTPLTAAIDQARISIFPDYLQNSPNEACRKNYVIVITDGADTCYSPSGDRDQAPIDAAAALYNAGVDNAQGFFAKVFVIGMGGVSDTLRSTLNGMAIKGGTDANIDDDYDPTTDDAAYFTDSAEQLAEALLDAIQEIQSEALTFTNPVIPSIRSNAYETTLIANFVPSETSAFWKGHLESYLINEYGEIVDINGQPGVDGNGKIIIEPLWDAGQRLSITSPNQRNVYSAKPNGLGGWNREDFKPENADFDPFSDFNIRCDPSRCNRTNKMKKRINWMLGMDVHDEDGDGNKAESRSWKLGDIFHSTPMIVGQPTTTFNDIGYNTPHTDEDTTFYKEYKGRKQIILAGANDGMLHAFHGGTWSAQDETYSLGTGMEEWAFVPNNLLDNVKRMPFHHETYVDSSPKAVDYWVDANNDYEKQWSEWHTIVVSGERGEHPYYFALDITDPGSANYPEVKWEFTDSAMGGSWSEPIFGRIKKKDSNNPDGSDYTEQWVMYVSGGYLEDNEKGNAFFVVDLDTGEKIWEYTYEDNVWDHALMIYSIPSTVAAVDRDNDSFTDTVFVGDLGGQIWKFEMGEYVGGQINFVAAEDNDNDNLYDNWTGQLFFHTLNPNQQIFYPPSLVFDSSHRLWIYFGTGDRLDPRADTSQDRFYGILDRYTNYALYDEALEDITNSAAEAPFSESFYGWYYDLPVGEKVLAKNTVYKGVLLFTTFTPDVNSDLCSTIGGSANLFAMDYLTGDGAYDRDSDGDVDLNDRVVNIGGGIPSAPSISLSANGKGHKVIVDHPERYIEEMGGIAGSGDIVGIDTWEEY